MLLLRGCECFAFGGPESLSGQGTVINSSSKGVASVMMMKWLQPLPLDLCIITKLQGSGCRVFQRNGNQWGTLGEYS